MDHEDRARRRTRIAAPLRWVGRAMRVLVGTPARAARGTARRVADPARQVVDYWISERVTMRQSFVACWIAALTALLAGLTLALAHERIDAIEGLFVLIPVSIGMRGNIFGALAARLGTSIHLGLFEVTPERQGVLFQNVQAATLLTVATATSMGILSWSIASLLGIGTIPLWDLILIAMAGGVLSSAVVLGVTIWVSATSFRRGWDLDSVGVPLITAIGDVVTLPCLLLATYLIAVEGLGPVLGAASAVIGILALIGGWSARAMVVRRIVRESFPVLMLAMVLDVLAGTVVEPRVEEVFVPFPALLAVIPGFLENTGALGGILASRLGSKLHLGAVSARARPDAAAILDGTIMLVLGLTVYAITAVTTLGLAEVIHLEHPGALRFIGVVMAGGLLATLVASVIGYYAATATYRFGFDPDNHTIPIVTSGMDLLGIICLVIALEAFGVA